VLLHEQHVGVLWMDCDFVNAVTHFGRWVGNEIAAPARNRYWRASAESIE
jgi:hypothetical protein